MINDKRYLAFVNYNEIDEERDLQSYVVNLRIEHWVDDYVVQVMEGLEFILLRNLRPNDICYYSGNNFQIRFLKTQAEHIIKLVTDYLIQSNVIYKMVMVNYIFNQSIPVGTSFCDGLVEAGIFFDRYKKERQSSFFLFYDRKSKSKSWIRIKSIKK